MLVLEDGTMRETMDELGHTNVSVAVNSYQRVVREHHRDTVELLAYRYLPSDNPTVIRTLIAQEERQIGKLRDEVERLRKILLERDTGIPTDPDTVPWPLNMTRGTFMIYSVVPTFLPATVKVLPQCFAELVQQIRFAADGPARLRFPAQPLDQIDESAFLLFHAVKESGAERRGISVHLPRL